MLQRVAAGRSNAQIGAELFISRATAAVSLRWLRVRMMRLWTRPHEPLRQLSEERAPDKTHVPGRRFRLNLPLADGQAAFLNFFGGRRLLE